jgi:AbrB family looped-hinge helix DNA binding protein
MNWTIASTNTKGQLVIPKSIREALGIRPNAPVRIAVCENAVHIEPLVDVVPLRKHASKLMRVLRETQGAWGSASTQETTNDKKQAALERKQAKRVSRVW